ncbi:MAG: hypothetical protein JSS93_03860 [Bacteroidetes bacterium]|nr:hypothetical protein [Bacteroidota bacterium]
MGKIFTAPEKKIQTDVAVLPSEDTNCLQDSFVYVHCHLTSPPAGSLIRIWSTTLLADQHSAAQASLVHAENISFAPVWTVVPNSQDYHFLLIFSALPKACILFDFIENIPQPGGFLVRNIARNDTDVYHIHLT